ncbi:hypothetical protein [Paracoccus pacificus]|uniref:Uncharacterized protein n=1 Tax=Paracoccus pacificus TaxID=1463598 RepID=A0ABW4R774_9RHOB
MPDIFPGRNLFPMQGAPPCVAAVRRSGGLIGREGGARAPGSRAHVPTALAAVVVGGAAIELAHLKTERGAGFSDVSPNIITFPDTAARRVWPKRDDRTRQASAG